jgi:fluoride ion exporter CrcB/FEX
MTPTRTHGGDSIVNEILVISLGAILGANARWVISRYAARILGPLFPAELTSMSAAAL